MGANEHGVRGAWHSGQGIDQQDLGQIMTLLQNERKSLIDGIKRDLSAYLNYKFSVIVTPMQMSQIRTALNDFEKSTIPITVAKSALKDGLYGFNWFYSEINEIISRILQPARVELGVNNVKAKEGIDTTDLNTLTN